MRARAEPTRAPRSLDRLLAALIGKLPPSGTPWPVEDQAAWMRMMAMALGVVYGGDVHAVVATSEKPAPKVNGNGKAAPVIGNEPPRYYIAKDGRALRDPGATPVHVNDVPADEVIWDERPTGKQGLDTIIWSDGMWPPGALPSLNIASG